MGASPRGATPSPRAACLAVALLAAACSEAPSIGPLQLVAADGSRVDPVADASAATVFLFAREDCPISNRYAPEVRRLHGLYAPRGVRFWMVYVDPDSTAEAVEEHRVAHGYPFGGVRDPRHELVAMTGATVTPEAAVVLPDRRLVYCGRIDDWYVAYGKDRPAPRVRDLDEVLAAIVAGDPPEFRRTTAIGCFIGDVR